ncbi:MAG TPA: hypothetical protein VFM97_05360 [Gammaproteobacteria bacterium]|nr:hypothetical protein [Gammaproteobacteria bacterium]
MLRNRLALLTLLALPLTLLTLLLILLLLLLLMLLLLFAVFFTASGGRGHSHTPLQGRPDRGGNNTPPMKLSALSV